ncbi:DMT family transporter [Streptomyces sp. NPDC000987]|uniref:DMT family transporter n=1 Tax=Streptomyces sp. NPDC000987 TaxID=3154374 RepID=UPI003328FA23
MSALALSVLLSFVSAVAYAGGAIVQEHVAVSSPDRQYAPLRRPGWWAAITLNGLGGLLHVVALAYGPLSLVQPLGALTIVFALPMAALFVGRGAGSAAWRGAIMATVGLAGLLSLVGAAEAQSLSTTQRVTVAVVSGGAVVTLMIAGRAAHRHPAVRSMLLATASGVAFGMSSVFTKTVAVDWSDGGSLADLPTLIVIGVFATAGVLLSQASYRGAGLAAPLATLTVVNPVVAAAVGITMFGETFRYGTTGTALALSCGVVAAGGLILLTTERMTRTTAENEAPLPEPRPTEPPLPEPRPAEPAAPVSALPAPVRRVPAEPVPVEPVPVLPVDPVPVQPVPVQAVPVDPVPFQPGPAEPVVAEPVSVRPLPAEEPLTVLPEQPAPAPREEIAVEEEPAAAPPAATADDAVVAVAAEGADDTAVGSRYHGPFYGGAYIPMLPVLPVRRRERVRS